MKRLALGKIVQTKLQIVVYHNSEKIQSEWPGLWKKLIRPHNIPTHKDGYVFTEKDMASLNSLIKYPIANFYEMRMWGNKVNKSKNT